MLNLRRGWILYIMVTQIYPLKSHSSDCGMIPQLDVSFTPREMTIYSHPRNPFHLHLIFHIDSN